MQQRSRMIYHGMFEIRASEDPYGPYFEEKALGSRAIGDDTTSIKGMATNAL